MRVPVPILDEKELTRLLKENPVLLTSAGHGLHDINIFRRRKRVSQGDGFLANVLAKYGPRIFPFLKRYILPAAKQMGSDVLSDMSSGRSTLKKSLKKRGLQSLGNVTRKVMTGEGRRRRRAGMLRGTLSTTTKIRCFTEHWSFCSFSIYTLHHILRYCQFPDGVIITSMISF